jgi:subtilisin family serine protease
VLCVGGVTVANERVGYSAIGPGRLADRKPDLCGYTHFAGSGVYPADSGTSAATPVVAGLVAALRFRLRADGEASTTPAAVRDLLNRTATPAGAEGYDPVFGWGIVSGASALAALPG